MLKYLKNKNKGLLDREYIRILNMNLFDIFSNSVIMNRVAAAYRKECNEEIFKQTGLLE